MTPPTIPPEAVEADVGPSCPCQADDARVCWMIRYGEAAGGRNPRCYCSCHTPDSILDQLTREGA